MSVFGKFLLLLACVCFLLTFGFKFALSGWMPFMGFGLGFAGLFFVLALIVDRRFYKTLVKSESLHFVLQSLLFISVTALFIVAINYFAFKKNKVFDLTENKVNSLSEFTEKLVSDLPGEIHFKYFYADSPKIKDYELMVRSMVGRFQEINSNIHFDSISVYKNPQEAKKFKISGEESALFAIYNDRIQRISRLEEVVIANAILKLTKDPKKIYFLKGHGEKELDDESTFGLSQLKKEMERLHYILVSLENLDIPSDAAFVALVGSRMSYSDQEISVLRDYVLNGGSLLLAIDPGESHGLANLSKSFGIEFQNAFTFDSSTAQAGQSDLLVFAQASKAGHELTMTMDPSQRPLLFMASPLKVYASDFTKMNVSPILSFSPTSESHQMMDMKSPLVSQGAQLAAIISEAKLKTGKYFRVFVIGDSDFLSNQFFSQHANFDFTLGLISYLSKDEDIMKFKDRKAKTTYLMVSQTQMNIYFLFFVLPFILLFFVVALFLKLRRLF